MNIVDICPFSKSIIGSWCHCEHAQMAERCSGKMVCLRASEYRESCMKLDGLLKVNSRFIFAAISLKNELTHAQLMKIRCGGLTGMQKVLGMSSAGSVDILEVIQRSQQKYQDMTEFPYNEIIKDIKNFKLR